MYDRFPPSLFSFFLCNNFACVWFSESFIHMTRLFSAHGLLEASNGWEQQFSHSYEQHGYMAEQNLVNITLSDNSTTSYPILCHSIKDSHSAGIFYGDTPLRHPFSLIMFNLVFITIITRIIQILLKPLKQPLIISQIIVSFLLLHLSYYQCQSNVIIFSLTNLSTTSQECMIPKSKYI